MATILDLESIMTFWGNKYCATRVVVHADTLSTCLCGLSLCTTLRFRAVVHSDVPWRCVEAMVACTRSLFASDEGRNLAEKMVVSAARERSTEE